MISGLSHLGLVEVWKPYIVVVARIIVLEVQGIRLAGAVNSGVQLF